jgi:hypothetical protein
MCRGNFKDPNLRKKVRSGHGLEMNLYRFYIWTALGSFGLTAQIQACELSYSGRLTTR